MMYKVTTTKDFDQSIKKIPKNIQAKLVQILDLLKGEPDILLSDSHKLNDWKYSYKLSTFYRLYYSLKENNILLESVNDIENQWSIIEVINVQEKKGIYRGIISMILLIIILSIIYLFFQNNKIKDEITQTQWNWTWNENNLTSWWNNPIWSTTWVVIHKAVIFSWTLSLRPYDQDQINTMSMFPKIKIWTWKIEKVMLRIKVDFNKDYQQYRKWRIYWYKADWTPAKWFVYALRVAIGDIRNWWYFDTVRIYTDEVKSDPDNWLFGATQWVNIIWGKIYEINLWDFKIANKQWSLWYINQNFIPYLNKMKWKTIPIWAYLSDLKWTQIEYMEIEYIGDDWAIIGIE